MTRKTINPNRNNDQIDVYWRRDETLAISFGRPGNAGTVIEKARGQNVPVVISFNKSLPAKRWTI